MTTDYTDGTDAKKVGVKLKPASPNTYLQHSVFLTPCNPLNPWALLPYSFLRLLRLFAAVRSR
jgi:hypothetical protein